MKKFEVFFADGSKSLIHARAMLLQGSWVEFDQGAGKREVYSASVVFKVIELL
jgi:hypothetical protein